MPLSAADTSCLHRCVLTLHEPRDLRGLAAAAPGAFLEAVPADYFFRIEIARGPGGEFERVTSYWQHPARASREMFELAVSLGPEHPFTGHVLRTGDLGPLRLSDFWSRRRQLAAPIHRRFYKRVGIGWLLTLLSVRGDRYCAINLGRPFTAPDFSQRDREVLGLLEPHLRLALDAAERETAAQEADASALAGLGLSARECDVAGWLARGRTNGEIASILSLRSRTVEKHVERILDKLGVENRTKAAQVVLGRRGARPVSEPADALELVRRVLRPDRTRRVL